MTRTSINAKSTLLFLVQFNYVPIEIHFGFCSLITFILDKICPYLLPSSWSNMFFFLRSNLLLWRTFSNIFAQARSITSVEFPLFRFEGKALWNLTVLDRTCLLWTSSETILLDYFLLYIFTNQSFPTFEITFL